MLALLSSAEERFSAAGKDIAFPCLQGIAPMTRAAPWRTVLPEAAIIK